MRGLKKGDFSETFLLDFPTVYCGITRITLRICKYYVLSIQHALGIFNTHARRLNDPRDDLYQLQNSQNNNILVLF